MKYFDVLSISIALILTAVAIILGQSYEVAYFLILIAGLFLFTILIKHIISFMPKLYFTSEASSRAALRIYKTAAKEGGQLIATHIRPHNLSPTEDYAINILKKVNRTVVFKRFISLEDKELEAKWINNTLLELDSKVETSIYYFETYQLAPSIIKEIFPRANLLLYNHEKKYLCLLGLDKLRTKDSRYKLVNFAIEFHNSKIFHALYRYFESITASRHVRRIKTHDEYKSHIFEKENILGIQSVIYKLVTFGMKSSKILHIGIFGKLATYLNGFQKIEEIMEHEADIDILLIVTRNTKEDIKKQLIKLFKTSEVEIVWGDDDNYFYNFRSRKKLTIDFEIHEKNTSFYQQHPLLGCSIFAHYKTIYNVNNQYLHNLVKLPYGFNKKERFGILDKDRKGLTDFKKGVEKYSAQTDLRRIIILCIKNIAWAMSGSRPISLDIAIEFLINYWKDIFPSITPKDIKELLFHTQKEIQKQYGQYQELTLQILSDAQIFSSSIIRKESD